MYLLCAMQKHVTKYIATLHISPSLINHYTTDVNEMLKKCLTLVFETAKIVYIVNRKLTSYEGQNMNERRRI